VGRAIASVMMLLGWGILAVPTGIISSEITHQRGMRGSPRTCTRCRATGHDAGARFCNHCGEPLPAAQA
jgi:voltage-gated potassium channel